MMTLYSRLLYYFFTLLGLLALGWMTPCHAVTPIRVGVLDFPPFYQVNNGQIEGGTMLSRVDRLMKQAGYPYSIRGYPAKRLFRMLKSGEIQVWIGLLHVPEYEGTVLASREPALTVHMTLYSLPGIELHLKDGSEQLLGHNVIVLRGYGYDGTLKPLRQLGEINYIEANDHRQALKLLQLKRGELLLDYQEAVDFAQVDSVGTADLNAIPLKDVNMYILVSKAMPNAQQTLNQLSKSMHRLRQDGRW